MTINSLYYVDWLKFQLIPVVFKTLIDINAY